MSNMYEDIIIIGRVIGARLAHILLKMAIAHREKMGSFLSNLKKLSIHRFYREFGVDGRSGSAGCWRINGLRSARAT